MRHVLYLLLPLTLAACGDDFEPNPKVPHYDYSSGQVMAPAPCPDWSHSALINYDNSNHSNYGCAVNNNLSQQLADPHDFVMGHGDDGSDVEAGVRAIESYRKGDLPVGPLPQSYTGQSGSNGSTAGSGQ